MELLLLDSAPQVRLADCTTLRLGGPAARFTQSRTERELVRTVQQADRAGEPLLVLGGGSNLVVADDGFAGTVVRVGVRGIRFATDRDAVLVTAGAGEDWDALVLRCVESGLSGFECLSGIPGLTGATPIQNVGAYGQEVAQSVVTVRAYDRLTERVVTLGAAECEFGYRTSRLKTSTASRQAGVAAATGRFVVLSVSFRLAVDRLSAPVRYAELARVLGVAEGDRVPLAHARAGVLGLRRGKGMVLDDGDPDTRSAGSFFTNPVLSADQFADVEARATGPVPHWPAGDGLVKVPAAWLIEHAGFGRGFPGDGSAVRISTKHTLALINAGGGSTARLMELAREVRDGVAKAFGVQLVNEPTLVGVEL
jgi:UDP-N-acetylmuramate dehydrogenase